MKVTLKIETLSNMLPGSGESKGAHLDNDVYYDKLGIPYIPAKRIKGCLRDSANEVFTFLANDYPNIPKVEDVFGNKGMKKGSIQISNARILDYKITKEWIGYILNLKNSPFTFQNVLEFFTETRFSTAINSDDGVATENSLRSVRVLRRGLEFESSIKFSVDAPAEAFDFLSLVAQNLRYLGTK